jgi:hypothetical protein
MPTAAGASPTWVRPGGIGRVPRGVAHHRRMRWGRREGKKEGRRKEKKKIERKGMTHLQVGPICNELWVLKMSKLKK